MKRKMPVKELLRWRFQLAKSEAPPPPSAAQLLDLAPDWWEERPNEFQSLIAKLSRIQSAENQQIAKSSPGRSQPIPALVVSGRKKFENSLRVQQFHVRDGKLSFCFRMDTDLPAMGSTIEVTFISDIAPRPLFCALAAISAPGKWCINSELPANLAQAWKQLNPTDRMPFRLILRLIPIIK